MQPARESSPNEGTSHERDVPAPSPYLGVDPLGTRGRVLHPAVEVHGQHVLRTGLLPGIAVPEPVIGFFHLPEGPGAVTGSPSPRDLPTWRMAGVGWLGKAPAAHGKGEDALSLSALNLDFGTAG